MLQEEKEAQGAVRSAGAAESTEMSRQEALTPTCAELRGPGHIPHPDAPVGDPQTPGVSTAHLSSAFCKPKIPGSLGLEKTSKVIESKLCLIPTLSPAQVFPGHLQGWGLHTSLGSLFSA